MRIFPENSAPRPAARTVLNMIPSCQVVLRTLLEECPGVHGAIMAKVDGQVSAQTFQEGREPEAARIAAVSSSLLALSETFGNEALGGGARYNSIVTDRGCLVIVRVPSRKSTHTLCAWTDQHKSFAMTLHFALETAKQLGYVLDHEMQHETDTSTRGVKPASFGRKDCNTPFPLSSNFQAVRQYVSSSGR